MLGNIAVASKRVRQGFWRSEIVSLESRNGPRSRCRDDVFTKQICVLAYGRRGVGFCRWRKAQSTNHVCEVPYCFSTKPIHEGSLLIRHIEFCGVDGSPYPPADLHHGEDRVRGCHGKITRGKRTGGNFEPPSACAPGYEPN
jgi:hypothetical protein